MVNKNTIIWIKANYWRFTPDTWPDWARHHWGNLKFRITTWWFWYSLPWSKTRRCPGCAGSRRILNSYDERDCEVCHGTGVVNK